RAQLSFDVDRRKAKALGVATEDVFNTLQVYFGAAFVNDFNKFGRTWQVNVRAGAGLRNRPEDARLLKVRNAKGEMVPLGTIVAVRWAEGPGPVNRLDGAPMVEVTANPAPGVSLAEARALCEGQAEEVRKGLRWQARFRLTWLREIPAPK